MHICISDTSRYGQNNRRMARQWKWLHLNERNMILFELQHITKFFYVVLIAYFRGFIWTREGFIFWQTFFSSSLQKFSFVLCPISSSFLFCRIAPPPPLVSCQHHHQPSESFPFTLIDQHYHLSWLLFLAVIIIALAPLERQSAQLQQPPFISWFRWATINILQPLLILIITLSATAQFLLIDHLQLHLSFPIVTSISWPSPIIFSITHLTITTCSAVFR